MPGWKDILDEVQATAKNKGPHDVVRRKYISRLSRLTKRNVIVYYSGWLQKGDVFPSGFTGFFLNDADKNGFMTCIHKLDKSIGLDLVLHTPGGSVAATESLVAYLRQMFGTNIRAIIPQLALSAGTMVACACKEIWMGKHSSLGPIDPQYDGRPAHGVLEEFRRAAREIAKDPRKIPVWQPIIARYTPTLIGECEKAVKWTNEIVKDWLASGMFARRRNRKVLASKVVRVLGTTSLTKSHSRHIPPDWAKKIGLNIKELESDPALQDAVLSAHHACILTISGTNSIKIIENQNGVAFIQAAAAAK